MKFLDRFFGKKQSEAAAPATPAPRPRAFSGSASVRSLTQPGAVLPSTIASNRSIPIVLESISGLSRLCFSNFDHSLKPLDASDDTQGKNIELAMAQIRLQEKRIGRVGKARKLGTIGLIRYSAMDGWSFRQALSEYSTVQEGNWLNFADIQALSALSFSMASTLNGDDYVVDKLLPGIVFDKKQDITRFFQYPGVGQAKELDPEGILYIEDVTVPDDTSFLKVLNPIMEQWKEIRKYGMVAEKRVAVPNETERIDAKDIVAMIAAKIPVKIQDLIDHCDDLAENQGWQNKKVALAGTRIEYPPISMPMNPWEADQYLKDEISDFFFKRNVIKRVQQSISSSDSSQKALLDTHIFSERELWGKPYEGLWNQWLEWNGFELYDEFAYWDWTPADQTAIVQREVMKLNAGMSLVNDARKACGDREYTEEELAQLTLERQTIKPVGAGSKGGAL
jgi:hypothetical protein